MKKFCLVFLCMAASYTLFAQTTPQRVRVDVRGGADFTTYLIPKSISNPISIFCNETKYSFMTGFHVGFVADIHLTEHWSLQPGLFYTMQRIHNNVFFGTNFGDTTVTIEAKEKYKTHGIKLPVMVHYHFSTAAHHFIVGAGVYVHGILSGKAILDETRKYNTGENLIYSGEFDPYKKGNKYLYKQIYGDDYTTKELYYGDKFFHRFNFGLSIETAYRISAFFIGVQADIDLLNNAIPKFFGNDFQQRAFNLQVTVGYQIN